MYIGKVKISNTWSKLEDLIKAQVSGQTAFAFAEGTTYQLQGEGNYGVRLCETSAAPSDLQAGERIVGTQTAIYQLSDGYLYVKTEANVPSDNVYLKISVIGE